MSGRGSGNSCNGTRTKTVLTEIGPVEIDVPRDTGSTFDPQIVRKRQRRLTGMEEIVLVGHVSAPFKQWAVNDHLRPYGFVRQLVRSPFSHDRS
ncbi:hypothetical protein ACVWZ8_002977 [Arthrobacter sp. UYCu723]